MQLQYNVMQVAKCITNYNVTQNESDGRLISFSKRTLLIIKKTDINGVLIPFIFKSKIT